MLKQPSMRILIVVFILSTLLLGSRSLFAAQNSNSVVVATVKGKDIKLDELVEATEPYKYQYEQQGIDFSSATGKVAYQRLQQQVLQQLIYQEILRSSAAKKGVTVSNNEVKKEYESILENAKMTESTLLSRLSKFGWTKDKYLKDLKGQILEEKYAKKYIAPGKKGQEFDEAISKWLEEQARNDVNVFFKVSSENANSSMKSIEKAGMDYYSKKYGSKAAAGASAKATNYGCHTQIDITKGGKLVKSLGYSGGDIYEIN